jgi:hypothetical protein
MSGVPDISQTMRPLQTANEDVCDQPILVRRAVPSQCDLESVAVPTAAAAASTRHDVCEVKSARLVTGPGALSTSV